MDVFDDEWLLDEEDEEASAVFAVLLSILSSTDFLFTCTELEESTQNYVDRTCGVHDQLSVLRAMPSLFKNMTNFTIDEFDELSQNICPLIAVNCRSTGQISSGRGRNPKLSPEQRLLSFILYLKHGNTSVSDGARWNWSSSAMNDDASFVASCVNHALKDEIRWPTASERVLLGQRLENFRGCIGIIDGTLCKIRRPWRDPNHAKWFNGRKKIYAVNNTVVVDHDGLFIYVDCGYPGSYHDVNILRHSSLMQNWREYFFTRMTTLSIYLAIRDMSARTCSF
jgi:hypothetical protein